MFRQAIEVLGDFGLMLYRALVAIHESLVGGRGRRIGRANLWWQMNRVGISSIPIVCLVLFCIGAILELQMAKPLADFGVVPLTADIVSLATFRELGPLVSAVVLTGFGGAAIAAELGTMVVGEEIEALEAQAIDPIRFLVVPRVLATVVMLVCLTVLGDIVAVFGGMVVGFFWLGIGVRQYLAHSREMLHVQDFVTGLIKAGVFGLLISSIACFMGLRVKGGAEGVGLATSRTVVYTIVALILVDLLFTAAFFYLGF